MVLLCDVSIGELESVAIMCPVLAEQDEEQTESSQCAESGRPAAGGSYLARKDTNFSVLPGIGC